MNVMIVTDAWSPQVNGVVRTLSTTRREMEVMGHHVEILSPLEFSTLPCPTYPDIRLSIFPGKSVERRIREYAPEALHIATEGPLGLAARRFAVKHKLPFTTAYHAFSGICTRAYRHTVGVDLPLSTVVPRPGSRGDGAHPCGQKRPRKLRLRQRSAVVARCRSGSLSSTAVASLDTEYPIFLYVGRVAVEKNVEAFLQLDLPGSKWVVGDGPALASLRAKYRQAHYLGVLKQTELAEVYAAADVFVFPSKTDTFGLVLLEAMAWVCRLPHTRLPAQSTCSATTRRPASCTTTYAWHAWQRLNSIERTLAPMPSASHGAPPLSSSSGTWLRRDALAERLVSRFVDRIGAAL